MGAGGGDDATEQKMLANEQAQQQQMQAEEAQRNSKVQRDMIAALRGGAAGYAGAKSSLGG